MAQKKGVVCFFIVVKEKDDLTLDFWETLFYGNISTCIWIWSGGWEGQNATFQFIPRLLGIRGIGGSAHVSLVVELKIGTFALKSINYVTISDTKLT